MLFSYLFYHSEEINFFHFFQCQNYSQVHHISYLRTSYHNSTYSPLRSLPRRSGHFGRNPVSNLFNIHDFPDPGAHHSCCSSFRRIPSLLQLPFMTARRQSRELLWTPLQGQGYGTGLSRRKNCFFNFVCHNLTHFQGITQCSGFSLCGAI